MNRRQKDEAAAAIAERRQREDRAQRLRDVVPELHSLRLEFAEYSEEATIASHSHTRHIVVERAPALFDVPCGIRECLDGGYEITREVLSQLRGMSESFVGESVCHGRRPGTTCGRRLKYKAIASYRA